MSTDITPTHEKKALQPLEIAPYIIDNVKRNLFLHSLKPLSKVKYDTYNKEGKYEATYSCHFPFQQGVSITGEENLYVPLEYIPALKQMSVALNTDNIQKNTILHKVIQSMNGNSTQWTHYFLDQLNEEKLGDFVHNLSDFYKQSGKEWHNTPKNNLILSKSHKNILFMDGHAHAEFSLPWAKFGLGLFAHIELSVRELRQKKLKELVENKTSSLTNTFFDTESPEDYDFWNNLFLGKDLHQHKMTEQDFVPIATDLSPQTYIKRQENKPQP